MKIPRNDPARRSSGVQTLVLYVCTLLCFPPLAMAGTLRCSNKVISTGASKAEVSALCGDPVQVDHKTIQRYVQTGSDGRSTAVLGASDQIEVETWIYNFGPTNLMQRIRFEDGVVVRIDSLDYGY